MTCILFARSDGSPRNFEQSCNVCWVWHDSSSMCQRLGKQDVFLCCFTWAVNANYLFVMFYKKLFLEFFCFVSLYQTSFRDFSLKRFQLEISLKLWTLIFCLLYFIRNFSWNSFCFVSIYQTSLRDFSFKTSLCFSWTFFLICERWSFVCYAL